MGSLCMELIDYELRRHDQWTTELEQRRLHSQYESLGGVGSSEEAKRKPQSDFERSSHKYSLLTKKQDQLLRVTFYLLLNIAEDTR
jgi:Kinesin-associated protein (KAP)